jgi:hypothetical protein
VAPSSRVPIRYSSAGRDLYARAAKSGGSVLTKRSVPTPTDDERRGTQGACLYARDDQGALGVKVSGIRHWTMR